MAGKTPALTLSVRFISFLLNIGKLKNTIARHLLWKLTKDLNLSHS